MNKLKYGILNGNEVVGYVYFDDEYGRTIVFTSGINIEEKLSVVAVGDNPEKTVSIDFQSFILSMIPVD